ncbi:hypothetical protein [Hymenobacter cheonanensis]|uniref:hypothetical protein n=1 Tax=Hymenobacter sp. CA2-7 TaxID=3063993 RepID=UPI0027129413|nr:hypothetical protein [Hymenobacter sp. CA2-7]MDO7884999.1 hypothetical protein [Hymenobacter sp. CA2-7]
MNIYPVAFRCLTTCLLGAGLGLGALPAGHAQSLDPGALLAQYNQTVLHEKLFVHLDRPAYLAGETMWLKVYATDATQHKPLALSKVAYVEVLNQARQPVLQAKLALQNATGQGSFVLPAGLPSGSYVVRAYTSWMKNFDPAYYFHGQVSIINTARASGARASQGPAYEVQFFPEGGQLVRGLRSKVGLRVVDAAGHGVAATGQVLDAQGTPVSTFETLKFGLGSFVFTPGTAGAGYSATVRLANNQVLTARLPAVQAAGYVLTLAEAGPGQLQLTAQTQGEGLASGEVFLLGHAGQRVAVAQRGQLVAGLATFTIDKRQLAGGITHFTLFDAAQKPRCERLYFRRPGPGLALTASPGRPAYATRQRVAVQLAAPAAASLSVAVYQLDSLSASQPADIRTFLALTSDLKGAIENPNYYLRDSSAAGQQAADNLMLTQGWSRFRWEEVLAGQPPRLPYAPELNGHFVYGRVTDASGKPAAGVTTYLASPSRAVRLYNSVSRPDGTVQFETSPFYGPSKLVLQTNSQQDSTHRLEMLSPFSTRYAPGPATTLALPLALTADLTQRHVQLQAQQAFQARFEHPYTQPAHDTVAFYGRPQEQYLLDDYTRFPTLEDVLREYVPGVQVRLRRDGFHFMVIDRPNQTIFHDNPLTMLDGVPIFNLNQLMRLDPLKVRKLDVVTGRYYHGPLTYDGVVSFTTYQGDLGGYQLPTQALLEEYEGLQGQREFYAPRYETVPQQQSRLPDFRNLLYWNPGVQLRAGQPRTLDFYTSDQAGRYLVVVQGLAPTGLAGSASFSLEVKPAL